MLYHLWNEYEHTVYIDLVDVDTQVEQTIVSNKIHPFFVQRVGYELPRAMTVSLAASGGAEEQHLYAGPIEDGHWIQAGGLRSGDLLLSVDESWVEVTDVRITSDPLLAYNLDVAEVDSFFVRGAAANDSDGVWVHNSDLCDPKLVKQVRDAKGKDNDINVKTQQEAEAIIEQARPEIEWN